MWRQSTLPSLRLWQTALEATKLHVNNVLGGIRHNSSAGARKVAQLERELARLKATSLEQLQAQARQQAEAAAKAMPEPEIDLQKLALQAFRESTFNMPLVPGQRLKATVIRVDRKTVWLDVGLAKHAKMFRSQVAVSQVVETTSTDTRAGPNDIRPGDVLHVTLETTETPFGDPAVSLDMPRGDDRYKAALKEIWTAFKTGEPIMGRLLNPVNGGYAVGVGGIVGFCPFRNCSLETASRTGILQPFYVTGVRENPVNMILTDVAQRLPPRPSNRSPDAVQDDEGATSDSRSENVQSNTGAADATAPQASTPAQQSKFEQAAAVPQKAAAAPAPSQEDSEAQVRQRQT